MCPPGTGTGRSGLRGGRGERAGRACSAAAPWGRGLAGGVAVGGAGADTSAGWRQTPGHSRQAGTTRGRCQRSECQSTRVTPHPTVSRCSTPAAGGRSLYQSSYTRWSTSKLNYIAGRESSYTTPGTSPAHSSYSIKSLASGTNGSHNTYRCAVQPSDDVLTLAMFQAILHGLEVPRAAQERS